MDHVHTSLRTVRRGERIADRYLVDQMIGRGGMSYIVGARDERFGDDVAIKILRLEGATHLERFLREARMVASLDTDHVVKVLDVGSLDSRQPFIVMERLRGMDLGARLKREGPLPLVDVADALIQVCAALVHAHAAGIIHRDIKPSNIFEHQLPAGSLVIKVLDFGVSRRVGMYREETLTAAHEGGLLGSPPYMSPEHIRDARSVDGRSDLWSVGVVAYRLLSATLPFDGIVARDLLASFEAPHTPLREIGVDVPPDVDAVIARCLARHREERFSTAEELARHLAPIASPRWARFASTLAPAAAPSVRGPLDDPDTATVAPPEAPSTPTSFGLASPPPSAPSPTLRAARPSAFSSVPFILALACLVLVAIVFAVRLRSSPAAETATSAPPAIPTATASLGAHEAEPARPPPRPPTTVAPAAAPPPETASVAHALAPPKPRVHVTPPPKPRIPPPPPPRPSATARSGLYDNPYRD